MRLAEHSDHLSTALACVRRLSREGLHALAAEIEREQERRFVGSMREAFNASRLLVWMRGRGKHKRHIADVKDRVEGLAALGGLGTATHVTTLCGRGFWWGSACVAPEGSFEADCATCLSRRPG